MPVKGGKKVGGEEQHAIPHAKVGAYLHVIGSFRTYLDFERVASAPVDPCQEFMVPRAQIEYQGLTYVDRGKPLAVEHDMETPKRVGAVAPSRENEPSHRCISVTGDGLCESLEKGTIHTLRLQQDDCKVSLLTTSAPDLMASRSHAGLGLYVAKSLGIRGADRQGP